MPDRPRILIADDEENIRRMLELHLVRDGFEVVTVPDGSAALEAMTEQHFDAAITFIDAAKAAKGRVLVHCQQVIPPPSSHSDQHSWCNSSCTAFASLSLSCCQHAA